MRYFFRRSTGMFLAGASLVLLLTSCGSHPQAGTVKDEAMLAGRDAKSFPAADEDYFHDMDSGVSLTSSEVKGRNTWIVWTSGNDKFWDTIGLDSLGALDFVKTLSSHPSLKYSRDNRWTWFGLVNEPCFDKPTGPDPTRYGLWLDKRRTDCPADPFENKTKYPGVKIGARGKNLAEESFYGYATGVVGMRLFPNPAFDEAAAKKWDPVRYYSDAAYYRDKKLIRPYRVGMSCGFCHVGPNPEKPPADPEHPKWENLSSNVGAQYFWIDRVFDWDNDPSSFVFQLFHTSRPGALDTSLVSTDNINNPRTMNAVYNLAPRLHQAMRFGKETLGGGSLNNKQFQNYPATASLSSFFEQPSTVYAPRVLKDGSDSVGALGALNRVYINIGLFSEEWLLHFNPLIGGKRTSPIEIAAAERNSTYWRATEDQTPDMALFFLKSTDPHKLEKAPGGTAYLTKTAATLSRGKVVFAETCARCHSSKLPAAAPGLDPGGCSGKDYMTCWNKYWAWTKTEDFKSKMRTIVNAADFLDGNYLSAEFRVPVTLLQTNACSPLATNAIRDNIWDNFSSETYKQLPSVGEVTIYNPMTGAPKQFDMPGGGRGFTRPPSLISVWSSAPFLLNNSLGKFNAQPSVEQRMDSFQDSIQKLLWPEKREKDSILGDKIPGVIDRTTTQSFLRVPTGYVPDNLKPLLGWGKRIFPNLYGEEGIEIGPIPTGTPVSLLSNINLLSDGSDLAGNVDHDLKVLNLLIRIKHDLANLPHDASDQQARQVLMNLVEPLMNLSKCPDYVVNRGHYFGTKYLKEETPLSDGDKLALIEFVKTF